MTEAHQPYTPTFSLSENLTAVKGGGVTSAAGFTAAGVHAGFRANPNKLDMALIVADEPCAAAGVFTQNVFAAAPVRYCRQLLEEGDGSWATMRALVINSKNANAATGEQGMQAATEAGAIVAAELGCPPSEVLVASTGVIGVPLPLDPFRAGAPVAHATLAATPEAAHNAACAIMTTDTFPKHCAVTFSGDDIGYAGVTFTVGAMAKGSGMIMPNMATMIAAITTDAPIAAPDLAFALKRAVAVSFNKVTVDSDTSTNDTCIAFASGAAAPQMQPFARNTPAFARFEEALQAVCMYLARLMAVDGEGATKLVNVHVLGAANANDADAAARTVANSPLVKTAIAGHDANWGRIAAALGRSGAQFNQGAVTISIMGIPVCQNGLALAFSEEEALARFERPEIDIEIDLGAGSAETTIWTCDLTHDYISINADYRS